MNPRFQIIVILLICKRIPSTAQDDELSFKVGDTIVDIDKFEKEWWFGYVGNRSGIFPCNHVEEIKYGTVMPTPDKEDQTKPPEPPKIITATALYDFVACKLY